MKDEKIRAVYTKNSIRMYQAYSDDIADEALELGTFGSQMNYPGAVHYFKLNPYDYFWLDGAEWHFTYEDIKKFKQKDFDPYWCCKDPHADDSNA